MRWEDERYVRLYTRDTPEWSVLDWEARAVFYELLRKVDRAGFVPLGKSRLRGLAGLLRMPVDVVTKGMDGLTEDGCVELTDSGVIVRNFIEAQEARQTDKARQRACRERARDLARSGSSEAHNTPSQNVTDGHTPSHAVTNGHSVPSCTDPRQDKEDLCADAQAPKVDLTTSPPLLAEAPPLLTIVEPPKTRKRSAKPIQKPAPKTRGGLLACAFAAGHKKAGAANYAPPYFSGDLKGLLGIAETFCPGMADNDVCSWITFYASRFVRAFKSDETLQYVKGADGVQGFITWLGRQSKRDMDIAESGRRAASMPDLPEMLPMMGSLPRVVPSQLTPPPEQEKPIEPPIVLPPGYRPTPMYPKSETPVIDTTRPWHRKPVRQEQIQEAANE